MGDYTCDICSKSFEYDEVLTAHKTGHQKANAYLFDFYVQKIKPTEVRVIRRKRKSARKAKIADEMPTLQAIEPVSKGPGSRKPKKLGKRPLPSIRSPKGTKTGRTRPHTLEPANISPPENKRPKLLLNEPEPRDGVPVGYNLALPIHLLIF